MRSLFINKNTLAYWLAIIWFCSLISLSSNALKADLGIISISPAVLIPLFGVLFFSRLRKAYLNEHLKDKDFPYTALSVALFCVLMVVQTIFSDWPDRAPSALLKTLLFFLVTHSFFAVISATKISITSLRFFLWSAAIFVLYLSYVYLIQFGELYVGNDLYAPTKTGRNTLSAFLFFAIVASFAVLREKQTLKFKLFDGMVFLILISACFLTGSRFAVVFPAIFLIFLSSKYLIKIRFKARVLFPLIAVITFVMCFWWFYGNLKDSEFEIYFEALNRLANIGQSQGDNFRLALIDIGLKCFTDNNMIFGHGVKNYLSCVMQSHINTDLILHNDHLSILNNVGILGYTLWLFAILTYSKVFNIFRGSYFFRIAILVYLLSLLVLDGYNSPIFGILLALARYEWYVGERGWLEKNN